MSEYQSQYRYDLLQKRWVIIASERGKRPQDFAVPREELDSAFCPFCPGHEDKTPREITAIRDPAGRANGPNWKLRVVPNKFPALRVEGSPEREADGIYDRMNGIGAHEVVIETPEHRSRLSDRDPEEVALMLRVYREPLADLGPLARVGILVLVGFVILYLLARYNQWALGVFHRLTAHWPSLQKLGGNFLEQFFTGLGVLTDGWLFLRFLFWMTLNWAIAIFSYYLIIRAFFPQAQVTWGMFGLGAAAFGGAIPSLPGAVGTFEGAFGGAITLLTGDQSTALAVALTGRLYNYINSGVIGGIGLLRDGQTLSGIYGELKKLTSGRSTEPTRE